MTAIPELGRLPTIVIDMLRTQTAAVGYGIGDAEAHTTRPEYPHSIVYSLPSAAMPGSGGVCHERIQRQTIQITTVGENRMSVDMAADHLANLMMDQTIRPRAWVNPLADDKIIVVDRTFQRGPAYIEDGSPTWQRVDRFALVVSPV